MTGHRLLIVDGIKQQVKEEQQMIVYCLNLVKKEEE
jgi:hypothetical protein